MELQDEYPRILCSAACTICLYLQCSSVGLKHYEGVVTAAAHAQRKPLSEDPSAMLQIQAFCL